MSHPAEEKLTAYLRDLRDELEKDENFKGYTAIEVSCSFQAHSGEMEIKFSAYNEHIAEHVAAGDFLSAMNEMVRRFHFKRQNAPVCLPRVGGRRPAEIISF